MPIGHPDTLITEVYTIGLLSRPATAAGSHRHSAGTGCQELAVDGIIRLVSTGLPTLVFPSTPSGPEGSSGSGLPGCWGRAGGGLLFKKPRSRRGFLMMAEREGLTAPACGGLALRFAPGCFADYVGCASSSPSARFEPGFSSVVPAPRSLAEREGKRASTRLKRRIQKVLIMMAEREGFEPSKGLNPCRFSRPVHSTALPPLRLSKSPRSRRGFLNDGGEGGIRTLGTG